MSAISQESYVIMYSCDDHKSAIEDELFERYGLVSNMSPDVTLAHAVEAFRRGWNAK